MYFIDLPYFKAPLAHTHYYFTETGICAICNRRDSPVTEVKSGVVLNKPKSTHDNMLVCLACLVEKRYSSEKIIENNGQLKKVNQIDESEWDAIKTEELLHTPSFKAGENAQVWLSHCNDFMAFIGLWDGADLRKHAPKGNVKKFVEAIWGNHDLDVEKELNLKSINVYAFQCSHCQAYRIHVEKTGTMVQHQK